jgi:hypothetical protein
VRCTPTARPSTARRAARLTRRVCRCRARQVLTGGLGTYQWAAPEVLAHQRYSEKADVFSFGVVLWWVNGVDVVRAGTFVAEARSPTHRPLSVPAQTSPRNGSG